MVLLSWDDLPGVAGHALALNHVPHATQGASIHARLAFWPSSGVGSLTKAYTVYHRLCSFFSPLFNPKI